MRCLSRTNPHIHINHLFSPYYHTSSSPHPVTPHTHTHSTPRFHDYPHPTCPTQPPLSRRITPHTTTHTHTTIPTYHHSSHTTPTHATRPRDIHPQPSLRPSPTRHSTSIFGWFGCGSFGLVSVGGCAIGWLGYVSSELFDLVLCGKDEYVGMRFAAGYNVMWFNYWDVGQLPTTQGRQTHAPP